RTPSLKLRAGEAPPELFLDVILRPGSRPIEIDVARIELRPLSSPVRP
ncbi:MAG: SGNH/GDSL hydrolase family protein, partial [Rhizobium oryzihabitans]